MNSTKIATIFLIILIALLGYVTYIKFTYEEPKPTNNGLPVVNSITLSTIETNYNNSPMIEKLRETGITTVASIENNDLKITYDYSNLNQSINDNNYNNAFIFNFSNGVLKNHTIINENLIELESLKTVYLILTDAVSVAQGNQVSESFLTTELITNQDFTNEACKVISTDTEITYVIDTTKPITFYQTNTKYTELTITDINEKGYGIEMQDTTIDNISLEYSEQDNFKGFAFKAYLTNITSEKTLVLKNYNKDKKELKKQELPINYTPTTRLFTYNLAIDNKIKKDDVLYYSVEIKESA